MDILFLAKYLKSFRETSPNSACNYNHISVLYFKDTKAEIGFLDGQTDLFDYTGPVGKCLRNDHPTSSAWTIRVAEIEEKSINLS